jgi:hypothetical protein
MQPAPANVDNNMVLAVTSLFFFWPTGIPAVLSAVKVNGLAAQGDPSAARAASDTARRFATISIVAGMVFWAVFCGVTGCGPLRG